MAKKVAVLAVNPVNGFGLFQYLEAFFENGISYKVYAVAETKEIKTNSGIELVADDVIANLIGCLLYTSSNSSFNSVRIPSTCAGVRGLNKISCNR